MTTIQILSIEAPAGRKHEYIRVFGYRVTDLLKRIVEVAVSVNDAAAIVRESSALKEFYEIEVPDNAWCYCANMGNIPVLQFKEKE